MENDAILELIQKYKEHIRLNGLKSELYKWELLSEYHGRPEINVSDFASEITGIKYGNLVYNLAHATIKQLAEKRTDEYRKLLKGLFDESIDLQERIDTFLQEIEILYKESTDDPSFGNHHDERTIATMLTFKYPDRYTFYKNSFYKKLCKLLDVKPQKVGSKYVHYLELIKNNILNHVIEDKELLNIVDKELADVNFKDANRLLLSQDILFQMVEKGTDEINTLDDFARWFAERKPNYMQNYYSNSIEKLKKVMTKWEVPYKEAFQSDVFTLPINDQSSFVQQLRENLYEKSGSFFDFSKSNSTQHLPRRMFGKDYYLRFLEEEVLSNTINYWIFQCNPKEYDIVEEWKNIDVDNWRVTAHKDKIKPGDKVILWVTGDKSGCYGLCTITSEVDTNTEPNFVEFTIDHNLTQIPIFKNELLSKPEFENFNGGNQGTNLAATKEQYDAIISLINERVSNQNKRYWLYAPGDNARLWDEFYDAGIMGLGWDELGDLNDYHSKNDIVNKLQVLYDTDSSKKNDATANFEFKEEVAIGDIIIAKKGRGILLGFGEVTSDYFYDNSRTEFKKVRRVDWKKKGVWNTDHSLALKTLTDITRYKSDLPGISYYYQRLLATMDSDLQVQSKDSRLKGSLNTILYGPPGTGKTFTLSEKYFERFTSREVSVTRDEFVRSIISGKSWWEVIALVLLDLGPAKVADIFNHEFLQIRAALSNSTTVTPTIWGQLQSHTVETCENVKVSKKASPLIFNKTDDKLWELVQEELEQQLPELLMEFDQIKKFQPSSDKLIRRYDFVTFHQSFSYEDFIEGIKPGLNSEDGDVSYEIQDGVFKRMALLAKEDPDQDYAIFIDEINRGNVASIFGELITLIEDDKREGCKNELKVTLPYSKTRFSVPPNLYVFGTMNTADRSVEALDTALRRRFSFVEMASMPELIESKGKSGGIVDGFDMVKILLTINKRIEKLIDKDHMIGHSYFLSVETIEDLKAVFQNKIIPLLQEYFFGDYGKIGLVLGAGFFENGGMQESDNGNIFATFNGYDVDMLTEKPVYHLRNVMEMDDFEDALDVMLGNA